MPGLPEITAVGTLVADPELRFTASGAAVVSFTVACNDRRFDKESGKWTDGDATFLRCSAWRQMAENIAESLTKGDRVMVSGQLKQRTYETRDGDKRTSMELDVAEAGPSLKWSVAKVQKASRSAEWVSENTGRRRDAQPEADDPWGSAPQANPTGFADEPPF